MDKNQLVPERPLRITAFDKSTGEAVFMLTEVENFQQSTSVNDETTVRAADGSTIGTLERGKEGTLSGEATFVNFGLMAAQNGTAIKGYGISDYSSISQPIYEEVTIKKGQTAVKLKYEPIGPVGLETNGVYALNNDGGLGTQYIQVATDPEGKEFTLNGLDRTIVVNESETADKHLVLGVFYEYDSDKSFYVENNADEFGGTYRVVADILCHDVCNFDNMIVVTVNAPNAKLSSAYDLTWGTEQTHPFSFTLGADYCSGGKRKLFDTIINLD